MMMFPYRTVDRHEELFFEYLLYEPITVMVYLILLRLLLEADSRFDSAQAS